MSIPFKCAYFDQVITAGNSLGTFDHTVLYAALWWEVNHSELTRGGKRYVLRLREELKKRIGKGLHTVDKLLKELVQMGWITVEDGMWHGVKCLRILLTGKGGDVNIHNKKLCLLTSYTGDHKLSMIVAFIDYCRKERPITDSNGQIYAYVSRPYLAKLLKVDKGTVDRYFKQLAKLGIINDDYYTRRLWGVINYRVTINDDFYNKLCDEWEAILKEQEEQNLAKRSKNALSIRTGDDPELLQNNNTASTYVYPQDIPAHKQNTSIILSRKEQRYLRGALLRTLAHLSDDQYRNPESKNNLLAQVLYAITNPAFRVKTESFKHAVNLFMWLIRNRKWLMPYGFWKYDATGQKQFKEIIEREEAEKYVRPERITESYGAAKQIRSVLEQSTDEKETVFEFTPSTPIQPKVKIMQQQDAERNKKICELTRIYEWTLSKLGKRHEELDEEEKSYLSRAIEEAKIQLGLAYG